MYGPPPVCKRAVDDEGLRKCIRPVRGQHCPGHDEYLRVSVLITAAAFIGRFFRQASGTWLDRSVISSRFANLGYD